MSIFKIDNKPLGAKSRIYGESVVFFLFPDGISVLEKPIPASYIEVERAITSISLQMQDKMPVLDEKEFR